MVSGLREPIVSRSTGSSLRPGRPLGSSAFSSESSPFTGGQNGSEVCFEQIRLVLDANPKAKKDETSLPIPGERLGEYANYIVINDVNNDEIAYALKTPSGQQSGIKIQTRDDDRTLSPEEIFCLSEENNAISITLDLDPKAIIEKPNSTNPYQFKPHGIRIIKANLFPAPESFIDGLVAVPTYNSAEGCVPTAP